MAEDSKPEGTAEDLTEQIGQLMSRAGELQTAVAEGNRSNSDIKAELEDQIKPKLNELHAAREEQLAKDANEAMLKEMREIASEIRHPSKANLLGLGHDPSLQDNRATLGSLVQNVLDLKGSPDPAVKSQALANIKAMGSGYGYAPSDSAGALDTVIQNADGTSAKATLGTTTGVGAGYLIPNALVTDVIRQATARNPYRQILQVIEGVRTVTINVPTEGLAPVRAVVVPEGNTKTNLGFVLTNYTVTLYTLAQIFDVSNQLLRHSAGAAESLVRAKLGRGWALGEAYYILNGSGSSEPKGVLTSLGTSQTQFVDTPSFTASATTLAGSAAKGIASAAGSLAARARTPDAAVVNAGDYYTMLSQGTDTAGFFFAPSAGPTSINASAASGLAWPAGNVGGDLSIFGIRIIPDPNMPTDSMVVGQWGDAQLFIGDDYRIDTSTEAGTRWDTNLTGFRGEEEIGFNADPYVASGFFQRITNFVP
jgi:HK97 family phage major capsid protein